MGEKLVRNLLLFWPRLSNASTHIQQVRGADRLFFTSWAAGFWTRLLLLLLLLLPTLHRRPPPLSLTWFILLTTRWRMAVDSGNSACTRCWLSEALWLSPRSPGASGPTAGGFYRPSGLGTDSGSASQRNLETWTRTGNQLVSFIAARNSPVLSLQPLVCETVPGQNPGLSVEHKAQRLRNASMSPKKLYFIEETVFPPDVNVNSAHLSKINLFFCMSSTTSCKAAINLSQADSNNGRVPIWGLRPSKWASLISKGIFWKWPIPALTSNQMGRSRFRPISWLCQCRSPDVTDSQPRGAGSNILISVVIILDGVRRSAQCYVIRSIQICTSKDAFGT